MKKFEYKNVILTCNPRLSFHYGNFDDEEFVSVLKTDGEDGWELVTIVPCPMEANDLFSKVINKLKLGIKSFCAARLVFKREIE